MRLSFKIALRFLSSSKGQTLLIALGIAIGVSVQIFIGSLIEGLQISLLDTTIGNASHITVNAAEKNTPVDDYQTIASKVEASYPEVTFLSPTITQGAFIQIDDKTNSIVFRGFNRSQAENIYEFSEALLEGGRLPNVTAEGEISEVAIGYKIAEDFGLSIGDTLQMITPKGQIAEAVITGLLDLKVAAINQSWVIGTLESAAALFELQDTQVTSIEMQIEEPFDADILSDKMKADISNDAIVFDNWKAQNEQLLSGLSGQSTSSLMIQIFVIISVVLGIASVLAITVLQKSRQLGILKAMGITDRLSSQIFLFEGFLLGIFGAILGIALGYGLLFSFSKFALKPDGTPVVPIYINYQFMLLSGAIAITASTLAAIIPAFKSKKLSPIEVIKNG